MHWGRGIAGPIFLGIVLPWLICAAVIPREPAPPAISLTVITEKGTQNLELEDYLGCVLQGEMPASFEEEALKAQAVAARTFALESAGNGKKHGKGILCTSPACCQDYQEGPPDPRIQEAVKDTAGMVMTYGGEFIEATYFSCSGGQTESALDVWGTAVPYLESVPSPGEEGARHDQENFVFSREILWELLELPLGTDLTPVIHAHTAGGGVAEISLGDRTFSGVELRSLLHLNSTDFTVTETETDLIFHTKGFGHRVGLSQYGAQAMAKAGADYREILSHYYPGAQCQSLSDIPVKSFLKK